VAVLVAIAYGAVAIFTGTTSPRILTLFVGSFLAVFGLLTPMSDAVSGDEGIRHFLITKGFNALLALSLVVMFASLVA
jgi:hypothetical protein